MTTMMIRIRCVNKDREQKIPEARKTRARHVFESVTRRFKTYVVPVLVMVGDEI